ncbi:MAG: hypothetical protein KA190_15495 [Kofleriaceae bacterium]|nr:hypothetical protein [Kofleriaceae bacterium]
MVDVDVEVNVYVDVDVDLDGDGDGDVYATFDALRVPGPGLATRPRP